MVLEPLVSSEDATIFEFVIFVHLVLQKGKDGQQFLMLDVAVCQQAKWQGVSTTAAAPCRLKKEVFCCGRQGLLCSGEDLAKMLLLRSVAMTSPQTSSQVPLRSQTFYFPHRFQKAKEGFSDPPPGIRHTCNLSASWYHPESSSPLTRYPPRAVLVTQPENAGYFAICCFPETDAQAPPALGIRVHVASGTALCLLLDFGDSCGAQMRLCTVTGAATVTGYHQYRKVTEGVYKLKAVIHDFHGAEELGPYYMDIGHGSVSVFMNSSSIHESEALSFADSLPQQRGTVVVHCFSSNSSYNVSFISQTQVGSGQAWRGVPVRYKMQSVSVYTNGTVFAADTNITFVAITEETIPLEFAWYFGENPPVTTTSRGIRRRLSIPQWYHVKVKAISRIGSVVSEPHVIRVQKRIVANRLMSTASALVNANVSFECRLNFGTDVAYLWNFGDDTIELGSSSSSHVYSREGEFTVEVLAFNNVSSATLRKQLFIVGEPCQPPPVKNLGPAKVQIWRSQPLRLGVTFEAAVLCNISQGLSYSWSFVGAETTTVTLPAAINTHRQTIMLPGYTLECGNYTAIAKVQIKGSMVYSNYSVGVEVRARAPVSVISEGTHIFISKATSTFIILRGAQSFDPDNPGAALRYHWTCTAASSPRWPCFDNSTSHQVDTQAPAIAFPARWLSECCDQFLVTLTVSSRGQNSSQALLFLSTRPDLAFRFVHISWDNFRDISVNWNEEVSLRAVCEDCGDVPDLTYSWDLFLVNATEKSEVQGPVAGSGEPVEDYGSLSSLTEEALMMNSPEGSWPSPSSSTDFDDFEAYYSDIQEAVLSLGRQPGTSTNFQEAGPSLSAEESANYGDNLLGPFLHTDRAKPTLMIDWPKALVNQAVFYGYTTSGIMGPAVTIKPFSLSSGETYVLQASVASKHVLLGKAQLYLTVNQAPQDLSCQVRPHHGMEAYTIFSVFCMSGKPDFHYEFRYWIGNTSSRTLYHGQDTQYYFLLPAGDSLDNYKVIVSTEITDGQGSKVQPCTVAVTVLPRYHGNNFCDKDLYNSILENLSTLQLVGSYMEIRNYITMITGILNRLYLESRNTSSCGQWSQIQDVLISSACQVPYTDQEAMMDSIHILRDLISFPNKLSLTSAMCIFKYAKMFLAQGQFSRRLLTNKKLRVDFVLLISEVWEAAKEDVRNGDYLQEEGMKIISDMLLACLSDKHQIHISTGHMEFQTVLHHSHESSIQNLGFIQVHFPSDLALHSTTQEETQSSCYISQLMFFMKSPYLGAQVSGQVGGVVIPRLYSCKSRRPILRGQLETPVTMEFGEEDYLVKAEHKRNPAMCVLLRDEVNVHRFTGLSENSQESLQIHIKFSQPVTRAFPIMLLVRFSERATPSDFLVKRVYFWDEQTVQMYVPAAPWKGANVGYLSLLDADYDRKPPNKYLAGAVNYTVHFQWIQCVFWDKTEWRSEGLSPQPGSSTEKVNCSYHQLAPVSVLRRKLNATLEVSSISEFQSHPHNLLPGIFSVFFLVLYGFLVSKSRCIDCQEKKNPGFIFLEEDAPPGYQLYAVVIDTGFRSPARFTSKVFIVLCGEKGCSETKELCCPEKPLFGRNSRHTFILSTPHQLGPLQKIRLWHDSSGPSPCWFISHVMVKELCSGQAWFFSAQCWLAVSKSGGHVLREFFCRSHGLGFWKLFYSKFTEYLEDFHIWLSLYSQPPSSSYLHTQRLAVSFCLLCVYSCLTALVTVRGHQQCPLDVGPTAITLEPFRLALLCTLLACPAAQLLSLLFRCNKEARGHLRASTQWPLRGVKTEIPQGPDSSERPDSRQPSPHPTSDLLPGTDQAWRIAASSSGEVCSPFPLEACRDKHPELREKSHYSPPSSQALSSGFEEPGSQQSRFCLLWSSSVAWAISGSASLACGLGTGLLGYRFVPAQSMWWLHLLLLSLVCCAFITQPLMICLAALVFAWKRKHDSKFFTESLQDATKGLDLELEERSRTRIPLSPISYSPDTAEEAERVLAARQRERHLRWAQTPSRVKLRETRERLRRESLMQAALRDMTMNSIMLLLLLFMAYGRFCPGEYSLNHAIRKAFIRRANHSLGDLSSTEDWWDWTLSTLLDELYPERTSARAWGAQLGALGGQCHLIGPPVVKQLKASAGTACTPPRPFSELLEDGLSMHSKGLVLEDRNVTPGGPETCDVKKESYMHSLGRTRSVSIHKCGSQAHAVRHEAYAALTALRASKWIDHSTRAMSVHFTLYNPPTRLFTSVILGTECLPTGGLVPSFLVESFSIFYSDSALKYLLMLSELLFLALNMIHLCFQLWGMATKGILSYWRKPRHWLELSMVGVALAYCAASGHLSTLAANITDQFHKGLYQRLVDIGLMVSWNQRARCLQGLLLFLWMLKCVHLLSSLSTMTPFSAVTCSLFRVVVPVLVGALLLAAHYHSHWFLLFTGTLSRGTSAEAFPGLLLQFPGRSKKDSWHNRLKSDHEAVLCSYGTLFLLLATLGFGMLRATFLTVFQNRKSFLRKSLVTLEDIAVYMWHEVLTLLGLGTTLGETEVATDHIYYLDEFSSLLDELLMKIDGLSDSLELSILENQWRRALESRAGDSPPGGITEYQTTGVPQHKFAVLLGRNWVSVVPEQAKPNWVLQNRLLFVW
ncbi:polycystic kidney disease protein 1-like 1 [Mus pahari]|uniref:polycystic kidney disease protein 1-like 1 n=1 Tax=Mus pahari TaxID=10093 RepID=UPI000A30C95E|nr:polycystic kidney disease protein 1-like 1 [Mus pahari]